MLGSPTITAEERAIRVTIFGSSTPQSLPVYTAASEAFGRGLARAGLDGVFGGGNAGCMGAFYDGMLAEHGRVHGITHRMFVKPGGSSLSEENAGSLESLEIVEGRDLTLRKRRLLDAGDCLVTLPGGVGTFDELFMAIAERGVGCGDLPVLVLNTDGYYDGAIAQLHAAADAGMLRHKVDEYVDVVSTPEDAVAWCLQRQRRTLPSKMAPEDAAAYFRGVVHGIAAAAVATAIVAALVRVWKP